MVFAMVAIVAVVSCCPLKSAYAAGEYENWANLMSWLSDINGKLQNVYIEVQGFSDLVVGNQSLMKQTLTKIEQNTRSITATVSIPSDLTYTLAGGEKGFNVRDSHANNLLTSINSALRRDNGDGTYSSITEHVYWVRHWTQYAYNRLGNVEDVLDNIDANVIAAVDNQASLYSLFNFASQDGNSYLLVRDTMVNTSVVAAGNRVTNAIRDLDGTALLMLASLNTVKSSMRDVVLAIESVQSEIRGNAYLANISSTITAIKNILDDFSFTNLGATTTDDALTRSAINASTTRIVDAINRITTGSLTINGDVTADMSGVESRLDSVLAAIQAFRKYANGVLQVHDEGVYDNLTDVILTLEAICEPILDIRQIIIDLGLAIIDELTSMGAETYIGEIPWDEVQEDGESIADRVMTLAPFAAFTLISAEIGTWANVLELNEPVLTLPFEFFGGSNDVVIDMGGFADAKPLVHFLMISMLLWCIGNMSVRIIEREAAR